MSDLDQRVVLEDNRPLAVAHRMAIQAREVTSIFGEQVLDPKLTRSKYKKMPVEEVAAFLQKMAGAIEEGRPLIVHSLLPNSIKFQAIRVSEEKTLPEVILPGRPYPREIETGTRSRSDTFCELTPAALERLIGDYCFLGNVDAGYFEIVSEIPPELRDPVETLRSENADLRKRLEAIEGQIHPRSASEKEADRRAALSPEDRAKEDEAARKSAAIRNQG
jgi:hypothetical protein